jgi:hypothetical protein
VYRRENSRATEEYKAGPHSLNLATAARSGVALPLNLSAFNGVTLIDSTSAIGRIPGGFSFPEGVLSFSGGPFNRIVLRRYSRARLSVCLILSVI